MSSNARAPRRPGWIYRLMMSVIGLFDRWIHLSCRAFMRLASERFERDLTTGERMRQGLHRAMCGLCRLQERRMGQIRTLAHELGRTPDDLSQLHLSEAATRRIREAVDSE